MNWYIGQEIVCIKSHSQGIVKQGQVFTIKGLKQSCCSLDIDVGIRESIYPYILCENCGKKEIHNGVAWVDEILFAPLEYDKQAIEELLENTLIKTI